MTALNAATIINPTIITITITIMIVVGSKTEVLIPNVGSWYMKSPNFSYKTYTVEFFPDSYFIKTFFFPMSVWEVCEIMKYAWSKVTLSFETVVEDGCLFPSVPLDMLFC
jgi:hypothetical protein